MEPLGLYRRPCLAPFWLWATFHAEQWGIFAVSLWYTYAWCQGIYNYWLAPAAEPADEGGYW